MNTHEAAHYYLSRGWQVVPIPARRKGPIIKEWTQLRIKPEEIEKRFGPNHNIGIILGQPSNGLVDIDLDCEEARELAPEYLPPTDAKTGRESAPESHWWYYAPGANTTQYNDNVSKKRTIELRSTGGQTVVGPSIHPSGEVYAILCGEPATVDAEDLTRRVEELHYAINERRNGSTEPEPVILPLPESTGHSDYDRAIAYLAQIPGAVSGQGGHPKTFWAAQCLVNGFCLRPSEALAILQAHYNPRCVPPWSEKELQHKVNQAVKFPPTQKPIGWLRDSTISIPDDASVDLSAFLGERKQIEPFPSELLNIPGFMRQVIDHNLATAHRPQPILALAGAIALQSVLAARKVRDTRGNRTNLYLIGLAVSGGGKDHARKLNRSILVNTGIENYEGPEEIASDAGLLSAVESHPARLFQIDEFGRFLKTLGEKHNSHLYAIPSVLLKLYSSAGTVYHGKAYADNAKNKTIDQPCVSLYATTVPESFWSSLTAESLADGFLARLLVFESTDLPAEQEADQQDVPTHLIEWARAWGNASPGGNLASQHPEPLVVDASDEAKHIIREFGREIDGMYGNPNNAKFQAILARAKENAYKLALVYACSQSVTCPVVDSSAMLWACALVRYLVNRLIGIALDRITESTFDAHQKRVLDEIRKAGGQMTRTALVRACRHLNRRTLQEILENLIECGWVVSEAIPTKGRTRYVFRAVVAATLITFFPLLSTSFLTQVVT